MTKFQLMTVLVKLLNKPRPYRALDGVLELIRGHDDKVRSVKLKRGDVLLLTTLLIIYILLSYCSLIILISKIRIQLKLRVTLFPKILFWVQRLVMIIQIKVKPRLVIRVNLVHMNPSMSVVCSVPLRATAVAVTESNRGLEN